MSVRLEAKGWMSGGRAIKWNWWRRAQESSRVKWFWRPTLTPRTENCLGIFHWRARKLQPILLAAGLQAIVVHRVPLTGFLLVNMTVTEVVKESVKDVLGTGTRGDELRT